MVYNVYAIRDYKAGFLSPIIEQSEAVAIRNFENACSNKDTMIYKFPNDFALYALGTYDTDKGLLQPDATITLIVSASDFRKEEE